MAFAKLTSDKTLCKKSLTQLEVTAPVDAKTQYTIDNFVIHPINCNSVMADIKKQKPSIFGFWNVCKYCELCYYFI